MEGAGERSLPMDEGSKKSSMKIIAVVIVLILIVAAIAGAYVLMGGEEDENELPTVSVSTEDLVVQFGETVTFDASGTEDPDGEIASWTWHFGDGETFNATETTVTHTYDYPGKYIILLEVEDDSGDTAANWDSLVKVEVLAPSVENADNDTAPIAIAAVDASEVENGDEVAFDGASSEAFEIVLNENDPENATDDTWELAQGPEYIANMAWDFGDGSDVVSGNFSVAQNGTHVYEGDGDLYASYLEVESNQGATQRYYNTIAVLPEDTGASTGVKNPDTFVMASIGEPEYLDPAIDYETSGGEILQNCYETLVWYDGASSATLKGQLATEVPTLANGGISEDGLNYTFNIREGVKFHDGTTMDVYDVEYSLERALTINDGWGPAWMLGQVMIPDYAPDQVLDPQLVDDSVTVDETAGTVTVHLIQPYPAFIYVMAYTVASVMSDEYVEAHGGVTALEHNDHMIENIAGTGPFKLVTWERNQYILLERFDDYWGGAADLKYVILKKVENVNTREMLLFSGEADCIYVPRQHKQDVLDASGEALDGLRVVQGLPTFNMDFIGFNQDINLEEAENLNLNIGDVPANFFADKNVRLAFVHAFDYDGFLTDVMQGTGEQPNGVIPAGMFAYPEDVPKYDFDTELAVSYLENTTNPDTGNSYAEDGFSLTFYYNAGNAVRESACLYLANTMEGEINDETAGDISIDVQALDWSGAYLPAVRGKVLPVFFLGWAPDYADPDNYVNPFIHQNGTYAQRCSIINQTITDKVEEAAFELNETARIQLYEEISMEVYENAFYVWTVQATNFHVEKDWVQGYYFNPMYSGLYYYELSKA